MWYHAADGTEEEMHGTPAGLGLDIRTPNVARIYDFLLGGKDNFAADRDAAGRLIQEIPHSALACRQNRDFLGRAVRVIAEGGIRQFLDVGSGLPTGSNVHQIAQALVPESRVVYVDYDHCKPGCSHAGGLAHASRASARTGTAFAV
jgi:hypothetical protein